MPFRVEPFESFPRFHEFLVKQQFLVSGFVFVRFLKQFVFERERIIFQRRRGLSGSEVRAPEVFLRV